MAEDLSTHISRRVHERTNTKLSLKNIKDISAVFDRYCRATGVISIDAAVNSFVFNIDAPLGMGISVTSPISDNERLLLKLIRAELNVILQERSRTRRKKITSSVLHTTWQYLSSCCYFWDSVNNHPHPDLLNGVSFQELMMTLAHWRCPDMIPESIQQERRTRIQHIVLMSCALIITDFLRGVVVRGKCRKYGRSPSAAACCQKKQTSIKAGEQVKNGGIQDAPKAASKARDFQASALFVQNLPGRFDNSSQQENCENIVSERAEFDTANVAVSHLKLDHSKPRKTGPGYKDSRFKLCPLPCTLSYDSGKADPRDSGKADPRSQFSGYIECTCTVLESPLEIPLQQQNVKQERRRLCSLRPLPTIVPDSDKLGR